MATYTNPDPNQKLMAGDIINYTFTGSPNSLTLPPGKYQIECWGGRGGNMHNTPTGVYYGKGGLGGYTKGNITIPNKQAVYMYVGGRGIDFYEPGHIGNYAGGWNGGGNCGSESSSGGGGASDIRLVGGNWNDITSLRSRIMVAAGGGGSNDYTDGGAGGGLQGGNGNTSNVAVNGVISGGTQTAGGIGKFKNGGFGYGGGGDAAYNNDGGGGGSGYYGGGQPITNDASGGGGSSFISGLTGCNAIDVNGNPTGQPNHYSGLIFTDDITTAGINTDDGKITITVLKIDVLVLCKNKNGIIGWHGESSLDNYSKILKDANGKIVMERPDSLDVNYTGAPVPLTLTPGKYKMECWGASGGWGTGFVNPYGNGGYTVGEISIIKTTVVWLYIGRKGSNCNDTDLRDASFNGGGFYISNEPAWHTGGGGGGASDIRLVGGNWNDITSLRSRIMVAAGGGGGQSTCGGSGTTAGHGGGLTGTRSYNTNGGGYAGSYSNGGSQTAGGTSYNTSGSWNNYGAFGIGANSRSCGSGGGGGYYGGGAAYTTGGGGGSSFISGLTGCNAIDVNGNPTGQPNHYSGLIFRNASTLTGTNDGNGAIKITLIKSYLFGTYIVNNGTKIGWHEFKSGADLKFDLSQIGHSIPVTLDAGRYQIELWGASGEGADPTSSAGSRRGRGGYTSGILSLSKTTTMYLFIGGSGGVQSSSSGNALMVGGFNGGGDTHAYSNGAIGGAGGGATDIRLINAAWNDPASLRSRIMVAAGGGGADDYDGMGLNKVGTGGGGSRGGSNDGSGGDGGGLNGLPAWINGSTNSTSQIPIGTQTSGYGFGVGGPGRICPALGDVYADNGGGGGGYYGGWGSDDNNGGGAGGSSFISGYPGCNAVDATGKHTGQPNHYSGLVFTDGVMAQGANDGNGKALITLLEYF